jgi:CRP-like cAMP-binding protein
MMKLPEPKADFRNLAGVQEHLAFQTMPAGTVFFSQGDSLKHFFFLRRGIAKVCRVSADGDQMVTELLLPGDLCGALCALDSCPYPVSALAVTEVEVARLDTGSFHRLAESFPALHRCSLEGCATKIRDQRAMMSSIALERIPLRVWKVFYVLAQRLADDTPAGLRFPFPFSRQEVAEMIGATNETVTRAFTHLKKDGEIAEADGHVTLLGLHSLAEVESQAAL